MSYLVGIAGSYKTRLPKHSANLQFGSGNDVEKIVGCVQQSGVWSCLTSCRWIKIYSFQRWVRNPRCCSERTLNNRSFFFSASKHPLVVDLIMDLDQAWIRWQPLFFKLDFYIMLYFKVHCFSSFAWGAPTRSIPVSTHTAYFFLLLAENKSLTAKAQKSDSTN